MQSGNCSRKVAIAAGPSQGGPGNPGGIRESLARLGFPPGVVQQRCNVRQTQRDANAWERPVLRHRDTKPSEYHRGSEGPLWPSPAPGLPAAGGSAGRAPAATSPAHEPIPVMISLAV